MLELRPTCENCNKLLPPDSTEAMICSFECTFCRDCVQNVLENVCPNCGGGLVARPVRPKNNLKNSNFLGKYPAGERVVYKPVDSTAHRAFCEAIKHLPPEQR